MARLRVRHQRIRVLTTGPTFGLDWELKDGLNVIYAANSHGKSGALNSLLYALGVEVLLGKSGWRSMKPALRKALEADGIEYPVVESFVDIDIEGAGGSRCLVRRYIVSDDKDDRLVAVAPGATVADAEPSFDFYFLRDAGAAQRDAGFHRFLAEFVGWDLPSVPTYRSSEVPLYIECIFPLFFIEQRRGWSALQATMPTQYGIRDVHRHAIEFVLGLETAETERRRQLVVEEKRRIKEEWSDQISRIRNRLDSLNASYEGLVDVPTPSFQPGGSQRVVVAEGDAWIRATDWLVAKRNELRGLAAEVQGHEPEIDSDLDEVRARLVGREQELLVQEARLREVRSEIDRVGFLKQRMDARKQDLEADLKKNQDALKVKKYGGAVQSRIAADECPTCSQPIREVLLNQRVDIAPMSIEENIDFVKSQRAMVQAFLGRMHSQELQLGKRLVEATERVNVIRAQIRDDREALLDPEASASKATIRQSINLEKQIEQMESAVHFFDVVLGLLQELSSDWKKALADEKKTPKDVLSKEDLQKLGALKNYFVDALADFGYKSGPIGEVGISYNIYRPTVEDLEIVFDTSASDHIRIQWAYHLALLHVGTQYETGHGGFLAFDEPGQQQISSESRQAFYSRASALDPTQAQVIVMTSEEPEALSEVLKGLPASVIDMGDQRVLRPTETPKA